MYPANHYYMDPYHSHYRNHAPYPYYPPRWEIPSGHPRPMDSSCYRPPTCGNWGPYNHDMQHSHPSEFHCCYNQTYPPDYYSFRPPFPQELPPPHLYYHGSFPQHPNACPSYFVPSHPYPVDHAPYGYDKFKSHCCGCPNRVCPGAEKSNVKIEEERPNVKLESEHKNTDNGSIIQHPNKYPFIWLPSGNFKGKENGEHYELSPQILNEWAPSNMRLGDVKQQEQDKQKGKQFQWPIVWMPAGYDVPNQNAREINDTEETPKSPKISEEAQSPKIKIIPLSWFENGHHHDQKPAAARNGSGDHNNRSVVKNQPVVTDDKDSMTLEGNPKTSPAVPKSINDEKPLRENCKTIPVVPEKEINEKKANTYRTIPVMKESDEKKIGMREKKEAKEANSAEKVEENRKTKHSDSSTAKHSKLPPVCLRVDPLPRKKSGNGSSRSPSPPTRKDADNTKKDMKEAQSQNLEPKQSGPSKHITVSEVKEKSPCEMKKEIGFRNETVQAASVEHSQEEEAPTSKDDQKVQAGGTIVGAQENAGTKSIQGGDVQENAGAESLNGCDECKNEDGTVIESEAAKDDTRTCTLSEPDAAVRIQSAYRGYDVRRWQPLDKLRKIRHVHEQMQGVRKQLQCLEDSCNKPTQKEQVAISETIMNLLLKLDTIQGLHPSVREARKSLARELICLQEKLDTLCKTPSGDLNHTNSNDDQSKRSENIIQTATPTVATEASDRQERTVELGKVKEPSSVDYMEPWKTVPSGVSWEVRADADASKEKNEKQESCSTTLDEAHEEGKAEGQIEFQVASSMDTQKPAAEDEESPLNSMAPLYDTASSGDPGELKQCTVSTDENLYAESNTRSPASTEDINTSAPTASVESEVETEKDGPIDSQVHETAALENVELKDNVSSSGNEHNESSSPVVHLEDPLVPLKDVEQHGLTPAEDFVSNTEDQQEAEDFVSNTEDRQEAEDINLQVQAMDSMKDSGKVPDETTEAPTNDDLELDTSADVEKHDQPSLLEPRLESISAPVVDESDNKMQCGISDKDEVPHVDEKTEITVDMVTRGFANCEGPLCEASWKEPDIQESHPSLEKEADHTVGGTLFPDSESCELSCPRDGGITVYEGADVKVSSENQTDAQKENIHSDVSETDECTETQQAAPAPVSTEGEHSAQDSDVQVSEKNNCIEMPMEAPAHATGANPAEDEASLEEDITVQTENKAPASPAPEDPKVSSEEKLAEENQKLKELLQKLLTSGNDQMGVITDLSEKVKALERKLARKKRPKVRVHRPSRHATAEVH